MACMSRQDEGEDSYSGPVFQVEVHVEPMFTKEH